ncbi:MAG: PepSY-associated TM helix domain-containing protein [Pseudomonadota bacterium]|uniref:PepSY-associated TM helix domain-containing protein n=1 Tax=Gallaecimonas pentaromativorans TaxID=584787 RepID=UPI00067EE48F|nr:PepSY-associated TM helix domain-containing protein [Gallaecimonas pentaromativorans]MED5525256.1 PepSY-associated TM helix domain-containing protein [Pseudomonadota bacterium]
MRKSLFKLHSWLALFALLPLLVISLSGSLLVFKDEIDALLRPDEVRLAAPGDLARQPLEALAAKVANAHPAFELGSWEIFDDGHTADRVYLVRRHSSDWFKLYIDPYRGQLLSQPVPVEEPFTDWLLELHFKLLLGDGGMALGAFYAAILLFLGISGLVLYRQFYRRLFTLRWGKDLRLALSDTHKLVGTLASPVLLALAFTGLWWNIQFVAHELEHEDLPVSERLYNDQLPLEQLRQDAQARLPGFKATYLLMPLEKSFAISFYGAVPSANPLASAYGSGVSFDAHSGAYQSHWDIRELGLGTAILDSYRELHFGSFGGLVSKVLWALVGAMPLILALSGSYLWWHRKHKQRGAKRRRMQLANQGR